MKTLLAIGCVTAFSLLTACGTEGADTVTIEQKDVRPAGGETVDPPGSTIKLGSNNTGGPGTPPPKKE